MMNIVAERIAERVASALNPPVCPFCHNIALGWTEAEAKLGQRVHPELGPDILQYHCFGASAL